MSTETDKPATPTEEKPEKESRRESSSGRQRTNSDGSGPVRTQSVSTRKRKGGSVRIPQEGSKDSLAVTEETGAVGTHVLERGKLFSSFTMAAFVLYLHFNFVFCISMLSV
jgi:hypothetical protein